MKKLMPLMIGMVLALGSISVAFTQQEPPKKEKEKKKTPKKGDKGKGDTQKKEGK